MAGVIAAVTAAGAEEESPLTKRQGVEDFSGTRGGIDVKERSVACPEPGVFGVHGGHWIVVILVGEVSHYGQ